MNALQMKIKSCTVLIAKNSCVDYVVFKMAKTSNTHNNVKVMKVQNIFLMFRFTLCKASKINLTA